ncbi:hypothetical protein RCL_jg11749.t1 [Rhizophagus clarus]|uniref:Cryptic loci regulator 2 N-terminal domain-containing protein n=1 Tax=Rhizophagus clarus TaxID=94130 RepID=A0A8H3R3M0_9GLOM|nr:hypothetical protein RCL_jg11749.t1 [Rhizophagus clarus]
MYYELLNPVDSKNIYWREKLGESMIKSFRDVTFPKAILTDFPKGYKLYAHRKKYPKKKEERTDYYLFGRHKFRSPNEFYPHLLWLISDKSGQCHCKYCTKSTVTSGKPYTHKAKKKVKRQRESDTSNEAPVSKRVTRSSSTGKSTKNRKISVGNRRKDTKKKRRPKVAELKKSVPPLIPKNSIFRGGEIVWLSINEVLNDKTLTECDKIFSIEYWPAIVGSVTPQEDNESSENIIYTVKPLILHGSRNVTVGSLRPWLIRSLDKALLSSKNRFTRSLLNVELEEATPEQIVEIYFKAIQKANEIVRAFTPMYQYEYHKKGTKKEKHGIHYKAIYFGAELIYEDDLVRLIPEEPEELKDKDLKANIQITGDLYERGKLSEEGDTYEWIPKNKQDEEYTVDVEDIAGRFYLMYPDITESIECELPKTFENRMLMLGEDVPPIIATLNTTPRELDAPVTPTTKKQVAKRSSPLPPILTESNLLKGKRTAPFSPPQDETSKRARKNHEIDIEGEEISTEINIIDEKEITIKQTNETKSIEKIGSPVKFSDIEKKYTKKSDDIDLPPLVVSPDTPTFETDDDISDGDALNKLVKNNGDKTI